MVIAVRQSLMAPSSTGRGSTSKQPKDAKAFLTDAALHQRCIKGLFAQDSSAVLEALAALGEMMNLVIEPHEAEQLCTTLRNTGSIEQLCSLIRDLHKNHNVLISSLMVLGNLVTADVDAEAQQTQRLVRAAGGVQTLVSHLFSDQEDVVFYACGTCMNLCTTLEDVAFLKDSGGMVRLMQLSASGGDVATYANGCIQNLQSAITHAATLRMITNQVEGVAATMLSPALGRNQPQEEREPGQSGWN